MLRSATAAIPQSKVNNNINKNGVNKVNKTKNNKSAKNYVLKTDYAPITSSVWNSWIKKRDKELIERLGQKVRDQRDALKKIIQKVMRDNGTHTKSIIKRGGLSSLQTKLYKYRQSQ